MLLECAIGDSYGSAFEYADAEIVKSNNNLTYLTRETQGFVPGKYTDDTQMSIAIAELLLSDRKWTKDSIAKRFLICFKRNPRQGYAGGFYRFLQKTKSSNNFLKHIKPNSDKSGGAMRACPIGILPCEIEVMAKTALQASVTHDTPNGIAAAQGAALAAHYFAYDRGPKKDLGDYISSLVKSDWVFPWTGPVDSKGMHSVSAAITTIMNCDSMSELLKESIAFCGDVDTVAAIACSAASLSKEIKQDIPQNLYDGLENGWQGREYLEELDKRLLSLIRK